MFRQNAGSNMCGPKTSKVPTSYYPNVHRCTYLSRSLFVTLTTGVDNRLTHFKTRAAKGLARVIINNQITIYESISIPINHKTINQSYRQLTLTHKRQLRTQPSQLFQASCLLVPVLTCPSFDPLIFIQARSNSFFLLFY